MVNEEEDLWPEEDLSGYPTAEDIGLAGTEDENYEDFLRAGEEPWR